MSKDTLNNGQEVVIFKNGEERKDGDSRSGFMRGSQQKEVPVDKDLAKWLACMDGDKIIWKINEEKVWLEGTVPGLTLFG